MLYYCTMKRDHKKGWLSGPFISELVAKGWLDKTIAVAIKVDPQAEQDAFGVTGVEFGPDQDYPPGSLNDQLGL